MNLCSDDHDEICHDQQKCPICELLVDVKDEHDTVVDELNNKINELETEINELKADLANLN